MICPICGEKANLVTTVRGVSTLLGTGAGGYVAATAGAKTGAIVGHLVCPGFGTVAGSLLGIIFGAASGAAAGSTVGKLLDEGVVRLYRCECCGHTWRA